jgi:hypothetical protein
MKFPIYPEPIVGLNGLAELDLGLAEQFLEHRDSPARLLSELPARFSPQEVASAGDAQRIWELVGIIYRATGRPREALTILWRLYQHMLAAQQCGAWVNKNWLLCLRLRTPRD